MAFRNIHTRGNQIWYCYPKTKLELYIYKDSVRVMTPKGKVHPHPINIQGHEQLRASGQSIKNTINIIFALSKPYI